MANPRKRRLARHRRNARKDAEKIKQRFRMGDLSMIQYLNIVKTDASPGARRLRHEAEQRMGRIKKAVKETAPAPAAVKKAPPPVTGLTRAQQREREGLRKERLRAKTEKSAPSR